MGYAPRKQALLCIEGEWSHPKCLPQKCDGEAPKVMGRRRPEGVGTASGRTCNVRCPPGKFKTADLLCLNGKWSNADRVRCIGLIESVRRCTGPPLLPNGDISRCSGGAATGKECD